MKKLFFGIVNWLSDFIYKNWPLYERKPVSEKDINKMSLNDLMLKKESERDYLYAGIPIILTLLWVIASIDNLWRDSLFIVLLVIVSVNLTVAVEEKKENIKIYDKLISKKMKEQEDKDEKYKKEMLKYLSNIEKGLNDNNK